MRAPEAAVEACRRSIPSLTAATALAGAWGGLQLIYGGAGPRASYATPTDERAAGARPGLGGAACACPHLRSSRPLTYQATALGCQWMVNVIQHSFTVQFTPAHARSCSC